VQLGWSFRPASSAWIILDRLDLKQDARSDATKKPEPAVPARAVAAARKAAGGKK